MDINAARAWCVELAVLLVTLLGSCVRPVDTACDQVKVSGTTYQGPREGKYEKYDGTCNNRVSYVQQGSSPKNYIFYLDENNGWYGWMIGTDHCFNRGGIAVQDDAETPDAVETHWEEVYGGYWVTSEEVKVKCTSEVSPGVIVGAVFGSIILIVLLLILVICCCKKNNKKRTVQNSQMNTAQVARGQGVAGNPPQNMRQQMMSSNTMYYSAQQHSQPYSSVNQTLFYSAQSGMPVTQQGANHVGPYAMQAPPAYSTVYGPPPAYDTLSQQQEAPPAYPASAPQQEAPHTAPSSQPVRVGPAPPSAQVLYSESRPAPPPSTDTFTSGPAAHNPEQ